MNENQIDYFLYSNLGARIEYYKGTYAADELISEELTIKRMDEPICFGLILNTLKINQTDRMGHWLAIHIKHMPKLKVFNLKFVDSYKQPYKFYSNHISTF